MPESKNPGGIRSAACLALLTILALLGNYFRIDLLFGADFLFGSIAVFFVIYLFGAFWGAFTAALASSYTYFLWGHPYAIVIFTFEALFVGYFLRIGRRNLLLFDGIFWLFLGMPLVWLFYHEVMHLEHFETLFVALKQSVNGISNALIANLLISYLPVRQFREQSHKDLKDPLHETLFTLMVAVVFVPALIVSILSSRVEKNRIESETIAVLEEAYRDVSSSLQYWQQLHLQAITELARVAELSHMTPSENLERTIEILTGMYSDLQNVSVVDAEGSVFEVFPPVGERGEPSIGPGLDFWDRAYSQGLLQTKGPFLSEVFLGKDNKYVPVVTLSVPILENENLLGYALAAFNLSQIKHFLIPEENPAFPEITLVNAHYQVLASTNVAKKAKETFSPWETGLVESRGGKIYQWMPQRDHYPAVRRWKSSSYFLESSISESIPWKVIARISLEPQQKHLFVRYVQNFAAIVVLSALVFPLALFLSRLIVRPVEELAEVTTNLPEKLLEQANITWPESSNAEIHSLVANFQIMAVALEHQFQQLRERGKELEKTNKELQEKIGERKRVEEALRESEERYREMSDLLPQPVYEMDIDGNFTFVNRAALEAFGYSKEEAAKELNAFQLLVSEDSEKARSEVRQHLKGEKVGRSEYVIRRKDGSTFPAIVYFSPILRGADVVGLRGTVFDLTEQKKADMELLTRQKLESLGVLAGGIAHDYNNILTGIIGNISLAKMFAAPGDRVTGRLEQAELAALRAKDLTQQLLTFARGGAPIKRTVSIARVLANSSQFAVRGSNVRCAFDVAPDLWASDVDEGQISQVIHNIVMNAVQAMPEGGIVRVAAENEIVEAAPGAPLQPGHYVKITMRDEGYGIPKEHLSTIFDPYFTTKQKGSGLGLATSYSIIKRHSGTITAESELGLYTQFTIYIPASDLEAAPHVIEAEPSMPVARYRILLMDDEEVVREVVGEMLGQLGYEVAFATDGAEAIRLYRESMENNNRFDAVIIDLTIPGGMGGREAILRLLEIDPGIKAIVSSGYSGDVVMSHHKSFGFKGVVPKPFRMTELAKALEEVLTEDESEGASEETGLPGKSRA